MNGKFIVKIGLELRDEFRTTRQEPSRDSSSSFQARVEFNPD